MVKFKILSTKKLEPSLIIKAQEQGVDITEQEAITIRPVLSLQQLKDMPGLFQGNDPKYIIFTSCNAVEIMSEKMREAELQPGEWKVACIEGKTLETLINLFPGVEVIATAAYGKLLAQKLLEMNLGSVYFFCGNIRRDELPEMLKKQGVLFHEAVVYETILNRIKTEENYDAVLFFSPSAAESYFSVNDIDPGTVCFAIGETTAASIKYFTRNNIIISPNPNQEMMTEEVLKYFCLESQA